MDTLWFLVSIVQYFPFISALDYASLFITGGKVRNSPAGQNFKDVLDYDPDVDKWTKVGEMAISRVSHAMSLVPKATADYCV